MVHSANHILQDRAIRHSIYLEGLKTTEVNKVLDFIDANLFPELQLRINAVLANTPELNRPSGIRSTKLLTKLIKQTNQIVKLAINRIYEQNRDNLNEISDMESNFQVNLLTSILPPIELGIAIPEVQTLHSLVTARPFQGETLRGWWDSTSQSAQIEIQRQLNTGMAIGESNQQLSRRLFGIDGGSAFNKLRRNATTIARTAVTAVTTQAREETYKKNNDLIKGVRYLATLDARTTEICASLDGKEFKIGQGPRPPMHMRCRSTTVPILKSWKEIGLGRFKFKELDEGQRASMDGLVPAKLNYRQWLAQQPVAIQNRVLGKGKAELFRSDNRNPDKAFERFVDTNFKPISLADIKRAEGLD